MFSQDFFESNLSVVDEATPAVDGVAILGKIKGQFFVPNGTSRNNRFYPKSLWEKQLAKQELKKRLRGRRMFGTISHDQPLDDQALLAGKISHIVTELYIDSQGRGMGEAVILNTEAGRVLNTVLRAGGKLFVSSRATGKFEGEHKGVPMVDENTYSLTTFDVVMDPGFLEANPQIAESLVKIFDNHQTQDNDGEYDMLNEKLIAENVTLKTDVALMSEARKAAEGKVSVLEAEKAATSTKIAQLEAAVSELKKYQDIGSVEEIEKVLDLSKTKMETVEKENTRLSGVVAEYKELGSPDEVQKVIEVAQGFREELDAFKALGTIEQLSKVLDFAESIMDERDSEKTAKEVAELAKELGVDKSVIETVHGKMSVDEIKTFVGGIKTAGGWAPPAEGELKTEGDETPASKGFQRSKEVGRATSIMEGLYKKAPVVKTK